jgi:hypothetical protein
MSNMSERAEDVAEWRITRDIREACKNVGREEARYLVRAYYQMQEDRIRDFAQKKRHLEERTPHAMIDWLAARHERIEQQIRSALAVYVQEHPVGRWLMSIKGIGPVISAGLLSHIDINKAPTVGHIWRFAGLDPTVRWERGQKRPWNAALKVVCWKAGQSFVKVSGHEDAFYGRIYKDRKAYETAKNAAGDYADQAAETLRTKRLGLVTEARKHYEAGRLPPARIQQRAERYAVKLFLAHLHHVMHETEFGVPPPKPYIIAVGGHAHYIGPPNWPME